MAKRPATSEASREIDARIKELGDWRGDLLGEARRLILEAEPDVVEEIKWRKPTNPKGVAVWSHAGIICTGEIYKEKVKLTFAKGAAVDDPDRLFNASLTGNARRAIDLFEGDRLKKRAFKALVRAAIEVNES